MIGAAVVSLIAVLLLLWSLWPAFELQRLRRDLNQKTHSIPPLCGIALAKSLAGSALTNTNNTKGGSARPSMACARRNNYDYICHGQSVRMWGTMFSPAPSNGIGKEGVYPFAERWTDAPHDWRFGSGEPPSHCDRELDTAVWIPLVVDSWNPYEGSHQHIAAVISSLAVLGRLADAVLIPMASAPFNPAHLERGDFPLHGLWELTFREVIFMGNDTVCAKRIVVPYSLQHSPYNTPCNCDTNGHNMPYRRVLQKLVQQQRQSIPTPRKNKTVIRVIVAKRPSDLRRHGIWKRSLNLGPGVQEITIENMAALPVQQQLEVVATADSTCHLTMARFLLH